MTADEIIGAAAIKRQWGDRAAYLMRPYISDAAYLDMVHCGDAIEVIMHDDGSAHLGNGWYCRQRFCPGCAWRRSLRDSRIIYGVWEQMLAQHRVPILVGLTIPNVSGDNLPNAVTGINRAYNRLMRLKRYHEAWRHSIRKLEITYNQRADTYHPHLHVLIFVDPGYWRDRYINHDTLLQDWRSVTGISCITQVDVRRCTTSGTRVGAIAEVAKYCAKSTDYLASQQVFDRMYNALYHKQYITYSGACATARKQLERDYREQPPTQSGIVQLLYWWLADSGQYMHTEANIITPKPPPGWHEMDKTDVAILRLPPAWLSLDWDDIVKEVSSE